MSISRRPPSSIMHRSFAESLGIQWPPEVALREDGRDVTWDELHERRRKRQRKRLEEIYRIKPPRIMPCYVWTFFNNTDFYHGWFCYVVTRIEQVAVNFRGFRESLAMSLMREVPLTLPDRALFEKWMVLFTKRHPRRKPKRDRRRAGSLIGWLDRESMVFSLQKPAEGGHAREGRAGHE